MFKTAIKLVILTFLVVPFFVRQVSALQPASGNGAKPLRRPAYVPGELLVKYKPAVRSAASAHFQNRLGVSTLRTFKRIGVQHVRLAQNMTVEQALEILKNDPRVEYAEPNYYRYAAVSPGDMTDTFFDRLWGLHNSGQAVNGTSGTTDADIDAPEAWDTTTGSSTVIIAVLDSGVDYNHPDLANNIWSSGGGPGWDFVDSDNDPMDSNDHGTHISGTIAAEGNNDQGITGVCWTAKIMPLRILDALGMGTVTEEVAAIDFAIDNEADIINASFAGYDFSTPERDAIQDAADAGILFVAAAGNEGSNDDSVPAYPANYDIANIIAVAATNQTDSLASFSNYGATSVHVAAPGTNIFSAKPDRQTLWSDGFDDGGINDWTVDGSWNVSSTFFVSGAYSLTDSPLGRLRHHY